MRDNVLILSASEEISGQLRGVLEDMKYSVVGWNRTGRNWFKLYSQFRPELLFVDLLLPERDGIYCINKLKAQDPSATCILLHPFIGAHANFIEARALKAGASAILQKPLVVSRLKLILDRFHDLKKA